MKYIALIISFFLITTESFAQFPTIGKEFWVGYMANNGSPGAMDVGSVLISAYEPTTGEIIYNGVIIPFELGIGENYTHVFDEFDALHRNSEVIDSKSIYIHASGKISVHAFNERTINHRSTDGTIILPSTSLGKDYYITSHYETVSGSETTDGQNLNNESAFLIIAIENNTRVEIQYARGTDDIPFPAPFTIELDAGETYQVLKKYDMTGTRVRVIGDNAADCNNIAVFGGNKWTAVGNCGEQNDHLFQQMYPISTWGTSFTHISLAQRTSGELLKIVSSQPNTQVEVNGDLYNINQAGSYVSIPIGPDQTASVNSNNPISVTVFARSQACNSAGSNPNIGDPFMITYQANNQLLYESYFRPLTDRSNIPIHHLNLITKTASTNQTILNGENIGNEFNPVPFNPEYAYARITLEELDYHLTNPDGFIGYVYGFGNLDSYGFSLGANFDNLEFEVDSEYDFEVFGEKVACLNSEGTWTIEPSNERFTYFLWNFGDGSDIKEGQTVSHTYESPGTYEVMVTASISPNSCEDQENVFFELTVESLNGEVTGPEISCPNIEFLTYTFDAYRDFDRVEWLISGGTISNIEDYSATVNWGDSNDEAWIKAIPFSPLGCPGDTIEYRVKILEKLEPKAPLGFEAICFDQSVTYEYSVAEEVSGRNYQWFINGGEIVSQDNLPTIEVNWSTPGITGEIWYQEVSSTNQSCEGTSDPLFVDVWNAFALENITIIDQFCSGQDRGVIEISVSGGIPPFNYRWHEIPGLSENKASNLAPGLYSVTISDQNGCQISLNDLEINASPSILVSPITTIQTSCHDSSDGLHIFEIEEGLGPFRVENASFENNQWILEGLSSGNHEIVIYDNNECSITHRFFVGSPSPLVVNIEIDKLTCPNESTGKLSATASGGSAPYEFTWIEANAIGRTLSNVPIGSYTVSVKDANGCEVITTTTMSEADPVVRLATGLNPTEELFEPISDCPLTFQMYIYNRWGELVYSGNSGWDGTLKGKNIAGGTYAYKVEYFYLKDGLQMRNVTNGSVTIIQ
ncbi:PKD domain-containing protein [Belliella kenyensis]|uniref:PKD domain-containing protein n=1 Tax=Belliella kenyensis TaxID=1472724 RepID=A0ABV8EQ98_9BACT|nr:PKD domain-containing protein [Belliella kenyensis]MCH7402051.1 PKD domain-containing protein [Belliella kenyensis]MDN3605215.1 PKD domain-containing protein [Belliella kenyensis]